MFQEVGRRIATWGLKLSRPDTQMYVSPLLAVRLIYLHIRSKAVAMGAISYYLGHFAVGRVAKYTYGTTSSVGYDHSDPEHRKRSHKRYLGITGEFQLDVFSPVLFKVAVFSLLQCVLRTERTFRGHRYRVRRSFAGRSLARAHFLL